MSISKALELLKYIWPEGAGSNHTKAAEAIALLEIIDRGSIWIPCSERMPPMIHNPEHGDYWSPWCLVHCPKWTGPQTATAQWWIPWDATKGQWVDSESMADYTHLPTHWMLHPDLPNGH